MTDNSKTITVTPETYKWLELFKTTMGEELEEEFTFDDVIAYLFVKWMETQEKIHNIHKIDVDIDV